MNVYRVETPLGIGPYNGGPGGYAIHGDRGWSDGLFSRDGRAPEPRSDGIKTVPRGHVFAFASVDQLQAWFVAHERAYLARNGFFMAVYKVDGRRIKRGGKQVTYPRDGATLLERRSLV